MNLRTALNFAKSYYFLYYAAWAFFLPFLALYYQELHFTGTQIGLLASIPPLVSLFAAPFWGGLADATRRHKAVLLTTMLGGGLSVLALSQARSFWLIVSIVAVYAFFTSTIMPLVDSYVLTMLGDRRDLYGSQRLWGAVGWGVAGPIAGLLIGQYGLKWSFGGYITLIAVGLFVASMLPIIGAESRKPFWSGLRMLVTHRQLLIFLITVFISGAGLSVVTNFLFLYMEEMKAAKSIMGLALAVATVSELPVLFYSGRMLRRLGPGGLLMISLGAFVIRAYGYSVSTTEWHVLIFQLLHGLTFSTMWVAGVSFAAEIAPEGLGATAQGLFSSTVSGFGGITGSIVGGFLLDQFGGSGMFFGVGTAVLISLISFLMVNRKSNRLSAQSTIK